MSEDTEDAGPTPKEQYKRWNEELTAAKTWFRKFHKSGDKVVKAFLDNRSDSGDEGGTTAFLTTRLNLYHANIVTLMSMLYGNIPKVEISRRFADADDDAARVAGEILTRILNSDIEVAGEDIASVFRNGLQDRLIPGLGTARVKYDFKSEVQKTEAIVDPNTGVELAPAVEKEVITEESVPIIYTHWKDILWSPTRTYSELRWKAYRAYFTKKKFKDRFKNVKDLKGINFDSKGPMGKSKEDKDLIDPQCEVWEIWDKDNLCVYWYTEGYEEILEHQEDPLELTGFWPDPPPLVSNVTTTKFLPKSDYSIAQDLYREIDELETRISVLTEACKCVGVYDKANEGIQRIFTEGIENQLIPVENWGMFSEKGGLKGVVDWVPIEAVAKVIEILTQKQGEKIQQLYQVTGMNDIMRGAAQSSDRTSATRDKLEANYGSIRIEALQNEFSRWVGDLQALKAEIISKHYQPQNIIQQSNILETFDAEDQQLIESAVQLIKDPKNSRWRIRVRPETLAIADYAQLKQDRMEYINGLSMYLQSAGPVLELAPEAMPTLMKLLKWGLAGFRGSNEIEGVLDQEINRMEKTPPKPKTDPAAEKAKVEAQKIQMEMQMKQQEFQAKMQMEQQKNAADLQAIQAEMASDREKRALEIQQSKQEFQMQMQQMLMEHALEMKKLKAELIAQQEEQAAQFAFNTAEREHEEKIQVQRDKREAGRDKGGKSKK